MEKNPKRILLVDDDKSLLQLISMRLGAAGYAVTTAESGQAALAALAVSPCELVITDLRMEGMDGLALFDAIHREAPALPVVILTAHGTIPEAVAATQRGVFGFLTKPFDPKVLLDTVAEALRLSGAHGGTDAAWRTDLVTRSPAMEALLAQARRVALSDAAVCILGASGTGKELLARAIHKASPRRARPFVMANCSAAAEDVFDGDLFRSAEGGTLLLDEIGGLPMPAQLRLLQLLQEKSDGPAGAEHTPPNVRIISTTNRDLHSLLSSGLLREDLYYRLNVVHIEMPPLKNRREDIPLLVAHFLAELAKETGQRKIYAPEAVELLATSDWPGNVRELANVVRQNCALAQTPIIPVELVQQSLGGGQAKLPSFDEARDEFTRSYLSQILQITGGNVSQAARLAKRNRTDFYKLLGRHQLVPDDFKER